MDFVDCISTSNFRLKLAIEIYDQAIWDYIASMLFLSPPIPPGVQVQYHEY